MSGTSLRPGAQALLANLRGREHRVVLWSAGGADYARHCADAHGLLESVDECHGKESRDADGRYRPGAFAAALTDVVFVDDRPEDMPVGAEVIAVSPYLSHNPHDRGLEPVVARIERD